MREYINAEKRAFWNVRTGKKEYYRPDVAKVLLKRKEIEPIRKYFRMS